MKPGAKRAAIVAACLTAAGCGPKAPTGSLPIAATGGDSASAVSDQRIYAGGIAPRVVTVASANPFTGDPKSAAEGKRLFMSMNCEGCHSNGGEGSWAPSVISGRWRYGGTDSAVFHTIYYGRPRGMPAFGGLLSPELTWKLVTFLRSVPPPKSVPTESWVTDAASEQPAH